MFETAVMDASPLIVLAKCQFLHLLQGIASQIMVPPAVVSEVSAGAEDDPARSLLAGPGIVRAGSIAIDPAVAQHGLDAGEAEVLSLAIGEGPGCIAVVDDAAARRCARALQISHVGCVGIVIDAARRREIPDVRAALSLLAQAGLYLSTAVMEQAVQQVAKN